VSPITFGCCPLIQFNLDRSKETQNNYQQAENGEQQTTCGGSYLRRPAVTAKKKSASPEQ
jgi:hypothetical protein